MTRNPAGLTLPPRPGSLLDENAGSTLSENQHGQIQAILNDPSTGLAAAFAKIVSDEQASVARDNANAQATQQVSAGLGSLSGAVTGLQAVTVDLTGKIRARFQQIAQVEDQIAGIRAIVQQDDGTITSNFALIAQAIGLWLQVDNTTFVRALGLELRDGVPVSQFYGEVQADSISVDKLKVNTAIIPKFFSLGSRVHGTGGTSWIEVASDTIDLAADGVIKLNITATQSFTAGAAPWGFVVIIDGEQRWNGGSIDTQGVISFAARKACAAGRRSWSVQWAGAATATLESLTVDVDGLNNTSG